MSTFYVRKSSGKKKPFHAKKIQLALTHSGIRDKALIQKIIAEIKERKPDSTKKIHAYILKQLEKTKPSLAARYDLKQALLALGPAGFPFEQFIARLLQEMGYSTKTNMTVSGACITHEIDIIATQKKLLYFVECKFRNRPGVAANVKTTLSMQAAFQDIRQAHRKKNKTAQKTNPKKVGSWGIINTRFTTEAEKYATCVGMLLTSWKYPAENGLAQLIDRHGIHPITSLSILTAKQKHTLISQGCVLCRDIKKYKKTLKSLRLTDQEMQKIITEAEDTCHKSP